MKHLMVSYAQCNRIINRSMLEIIEKQVEAPWNHAIEGYHFKTLGQILEHVFVADMLWLKSFADLASYGLSLVDEVRAIPSYGEKVFSSFADYCQARAKLDDYICRYIDVSDDVLYGKVVSRKLRSGVQLARSASLALVHFFNHQTHHRGQVSNLLDAMGVENDYSNMITLEF